MHIIEKEMMEHESDADEVELPLFLQGELPPLLKNGTRLPSYIKDHRKVSINAAADQAAFCVSTSCALIMS